MCRVFMERAHDSDIHELMALTHLDLSEKTDDVKTAEGKLLKNVKQSAAYETIHLYKKLYFNPGFSMWSLTQKIFEL